MNVTDFPSIERFSASSDFELKLVTIRSLGIGSVPRSRPSVERLSRKIGELTPKLPSEPELFHTLCESLRLGASPLSLETPQVTVTFVVPPAVSGTATTVLPFGPPAHPRGNTSPIVMVAAVPSYTLRLNTRLSSLNSKCSDRPCSPSPWASNPTANPPNTKHTNPAAGKSFLFK